MSATSKKSIFGAVDETLIQSIVLDSFGAQIIDVLFYDAEGLEVIPTSGYYSIQYTPNKKTWVDFEGTQFPAKVSQNVEDWQASGYIEQIRAVPVDIIGAVTWEVKFRTHGIGMPSLVARSITANRYFSGVSTIQVSGFDHSVLQGNAISVSNRVTVPANSRVSIKTRKNCDAVIVHATANGVFISYVDGDVSGNLISVVSGAKLNTLEEFRFESSFEFYDGPAIGIPASTDKDRINEFFVINGGGVIELENLTDTDVTTFFSCGIVALSPPIVPFMLTSETLLQPTTEMSTYNGIN